MKRLVPLIAFPIALFAVSCSESWEEIPKEEAASEEAAVTESETTGDPALLACQSFLLEFPVKKERSIWKTILDQPPLFPFDAEKTYFWNIETNHGNLKVRLMPETAPMHVSSTIYLSEIGYYDDLTFHRIITGFMAQGGCPQGTGTGSPGYKYDGEFDPSVKHDRPGLLSMANAGPGTDGSQFFLTFVPTPHLNGKHTIFGEVVEGLEVLKSLESIGTARGKPTGPANMIKTTITVE